MGNDAGVITSARQEATQFLLPKKTANFNQTIIMTSLNTSPFFVPGNHQIKKPSRLHVCEFSWKKAEIPPTLWSLIFSTLYYNRTLMPPIFFANCNRILWILRILIPPINQRQCGLWWFWRENSNGKKVVLKLCEILQNWNWSNNAAINWICLIWKGVTLWHCLRLDFLLRKLILTRCEVLQCRNSI